MAPSAFSSQGLPRLQKFNVLLGKTPTLGEGEEFGVTPLSSAWMTSSLAVALSMPNQDLLFHFNRARRRRYTLPWYIKYLSGVENIIFA